MGIKHNQIIANYNKDSSGNAFTVMLTEKHEISPTSYQIQLSQIPSEIERLRIDGMHEVFDVEDIVEDSYKVVSYNDRRVQFHSSKGAKEVTVTYGGIGVEYISADSVWLITDAQGNVLQTLKGWMDFAEIQMEIIKVFGDCGKIIIEMRESIGKMEDFVSEFEELLERADDIENKMINNKSLTITSQMWGNKQSDGYYHYTWNHGLGSRALNVDVYTNTSKGLEFSTVQGIIKDINNVEVISEDMTELNVVISAKQYGGLIPSLVAFSTDDLTEGIVNKYVQSKSFNLLANQFTLVDGLYEATLTHDLNRKMFLNKKAFVNEKEIYVAFDEISNTQIKIFNTVAENCKIVLQWTGGM